MVSMQGPLGICSQMLSHPAHFNPVGKGFRPSLHVVTIFMNAEHIGPLHRAQGKLSSECEHLGTARLESSS